MDIQLVPVLAALKPGAILITALGLGLVIFFHELGHFLVAKWCGVYVERFSIGFGSPILSRKWGETEYVLGWLPLGGYVKMRGQDDMDPGEMTDEEIAEDPRSYTAKTVPQRMAIISAGVIMNIITGMMFFMIAFHHGVETIDRTIGHVQVGSPAWTHGIRSGDEILRMNNHPVHDYSDIMLNTALSRGDVTIEGRHLDGSEFSFSVEPEKKNKSKRTLGVSSTSSLELLPAEYLEDNPVLVQPNSGAAEAGLEPGDEITSVNDVKVANYVEFVTELANHASEEVTLGVVRADSKSKARSEVELKVKPQPGLDLGFRVSMGKVTGLRIDGIAAQAGFREGDRIAKVDGLDVENDLDPFLLTEYFSNHAGQEVVVDVFREKGGSDGSTVSLKVVPENRPAWSEPPAFEESPLSIPSIGLAYNVTPIVFSVDEDGAATKSGIEERDSIIGVTLILPEGEKDWGTSEPKITIELEKKDNWAYAFWTIQTTGRSRQIELKVKKAGGEKEVFKITPAYSKEWFVQDTRGIRFLPKTLVQKAESIPDSLSMSSDFTMKSIRQVYLTLRGLITQDISIKLMSGPIGIAQAAYSTAKTGLPQFLQFLGLISINLAVVNFLPIPVLDGGHMVLLLWEGITRKKPSEKVVGIATWIGLVLLLTLIATVVILDLFVPKI
ncbi:MAG: RIP metalloprotease RseP [Planctomycetaceae bacterium]